MIIDHQALSAEALRGVIEDFVSREGTDYGHSDWSLDEKVSSVLQQLHAGFAVVVFDSELESCSIQPAVNGKLTEL